MKRVELTVLISPDLLDRIDQHAEGCGETRSAVVNRWIERGLAAEGSPSPKERRRAMLRENRELAFVVKTVDQLQALDRLEQHRKRLIRGLNGGRNAAPK
jgi:hypothetical protein